MKSRSIPALVLVLFVNGLFSWADGGTDKKNANALDERFAEVEIDKAFHGLLSAHPHLMETMGAKIIKLADGNQGVHVYSVQQLESRTTLVVDDKSPKTKSVASYFEITQERIQGVAKDMPVVGRWQAKDGSVSYLAIGVCCDKKGEPIPKKAAK